MSKHGIRHHFRFFRFLYPFSINFVATACDKDLHRSMLCHVYFWIAFLIVSVTWLKIVLTITPETKITPFHYSIMYFCYWLCCVVGFFEMLRKSYTNKINKLISEIDDLDYNLKYRETTKEVCRKLISTILILGLDLAICVLIAKSVNEIKNPLILLFMNVACDVEIGCLSMFASMLSARIKYFVNHLNEVLHKEINSGDVDILLCYRQILHILKRITKIWQLQVRN